MKHNCCGESKWLIDYDETVNIWHMTVKGAYQIQVDFCPWCGEKLPILERSQTHRVAIGDYVVKTKEGEIRVLPREANGHDGILYAKITDVLIGTLCELKEHFEDHLVSIQPKLYFGHICRLSIKAIRDLTINEYF